jgi:uncharacterized protein (TIGR00255 family)
MTTLMSMTGFGAASGEVENVHYDVEVRSVNNRYLKVSLRLPESLSGLEGRIEKVARQALQRGSVSLSVRMKLPDEQAVYSVNTVALMNYLDQLRPLEVEANPTLRVDLGSLMQLPGVCQPPPLEELAEKTADGLLELVDQALAELRAMRQREGGAIGEDLLANAALIDEKLQAVDARKDTVLQEYHDRLRQRVETLTAQAKINLDEETLAREVAIFAERSDVAEELSRLGTHVKEFLQMCRNGDGPIGRKLDFMAQEMLREANTIGSKSTDPQIARAVVDMKTAIDRIKEQAANIE